MIYEAEIELLGDNSRIVVDFTYQYGLKKMSEYYARVHSGRYISADEARRDIAETCIREQHPKLGIFNVKEC